MNGAPIPSVYSFSNHTQTGQRPDVVGSIRSAQPGQVLMHGVGAPPTLHVPSLSQSPLQAVGQPLHAKHQLPQLHQLPHLQHQTPIQFHQALPPSVQPPQSQSPQQPRLHFQHPPQPSQPQSHFHAPSHSIYQSPSPYYIPTFPSSIPNIASIRKAPENVEMISEPPAKEVDPFTIEESISLLTTIEPSDINEYTEHVFKIVSILHDDLTKDSEQIKNLRQTYFKLIDKFDTYIDYDEPINSKLHLLIERNFDLFIRISTNHNDVEISTKTIRFLTNIVMNLNYWELYNLLTWKPAIFHFLNVIHFDLNECYHKFIEDYTQFNYKKFNQLEKSQAAREAKRAKRAAAASRRSRNQSPGSDDSSVTNDDDESGSQTPSSFLSSNPGYSENKLSNGGISAREKKRLRAEAKLAAHRVIKKTAVSKATAKSSNYDPDVVHECQLPSPDEPHKVCMRRFSRKYELIRHQETVHSKKKKLFKCFVCVKQNPGIGPRIFTRHDTLAKHIRVNHKISGKEAKAEVAYSKKNAEVVEEGDITVHVGRRKTKVDFELRAHMEKKRLSKDPNDMDDSGFLETNSELDSGDEEVVFNN